MIEPDDLQPWERQPGEPSRWFGLFTMYRLLGVNRTLIEGYKKYRKKKRLKVSKGVRIPGAWQKMSSTWNWKERAEAWDQHIQAEAIAKEEARQRKILSTGFAVMANRVEALNELAVVLKEESLTKERRYMKDVKSIGAGMFAERVDLERFNSGLIEQTRGVLDDLAKETGGRKQTVDVTSKGQTVNQSTVVELPKKDFLE